MRSPRRFALTWVLFLPGGEAAVTVDSDLPLCAARAQARAEMPGGTACSPPGT
jgi:hypothetical protein